MATNYPAGIDTFPTVGAATTMDTAGSEHDLLHNNIADAVKAIQATLGLDPAGIYTDVAERLYLITSGGAVNIATTQPAAPAVGDLWLDINSAPPANSYSDLGNAGTAKTINGNDADVQKLTLNSALCTLTFAGTPTIGYVRRWELHITHDATTSDRELSWPGTIRWPSGVAPTLLATTANAVGIIRFVTRDDGVTFGQHIGNYT